MVAPASRGMVQNITNTGRAGLTFFFDTGPCQPNTGSNGTDCRCHRSEQPPPSRKNRGKPNDVTLRESTTCTSKQLETHGRRIAIRGTALIQLVSHNYQHIKGLLVCAMGHRISYIPVTVTSMHSSIRSFRQEHRTRLQPTRIYNRLPVTVLSPVFGTACVW